MQITQSRNFLRQQKEVFILFFFIVQIGIISQPCSEKAFPFNNDILVHNFTYRDDVSETEVNHNIRNKMDIVTYLGKKGRFLLDKTR